MYKGDDKIPMGSWLKLSIFYLTEESQTTKSKVKVY